MTLGAIGDLERFFGEVIYPNRFVFGLAAALLVGALAWLAIRRRWDLPIRRHPRRTALVIGPLLAIVLPAGWILASPLFVRTTLIEAAPGVEATSARHGTQSDVRSVADAAVLLMGSFQGADEFHFGSGQAQLLETDDGSVVLRLSDFSVLNGPDLHVYLSPSLDGYADGAVDLGPLKATDGSFSYDVPEGVDLAGVRSVVIWCVPFGVQFAHATLAAP